jgi:DNA-binding response OmpR family regulator
VPGAALSVFVIDDDREALSIFDEILRANGFDVRTAATAESGLLQLEAEPPAMIVLDLRLPALDGLECLRRIRAIPGLVRTPVTVITGDYLIEESMVAEVEALRARLCFKPIWEEDLLRIVRADIGLQQQGPTA